ncbi:type II secretion system protein [Neptuniibacter sp. QD34_54]|uniref:type II secretion system protein n=1 Tax=Neptuniibacter sp. QD34_54 TaxID=3398208 RepID=UPI0039F5EAA6
MKNVVNKQHGFTLLELVIVVAVMGLIASLATEFVVHETNQKRFATTKEKREDVRLAVHRYYKNFGVFPPNLKELIVCSTSCSQWQGPYLLDVDFEGLTPVFRDGWGTVSNTDDTLNYGWIYNNYSNASVALTSYGLDGSLGITSNASSAEAVYEKDYPPTIFPLTTSSAASTAAQSLP